MSVPFRTPLAAFLLTSFMVAAAGCGSSTPTTPTTAVVTPAVSQLILGALTVGGTDATKSFTLTSALTVNLTLVSLARVSNGVALSNAVTMGIGTFDGTNCTPTTTPVSVTPALTAQVTVALGAGNYCVVMRDTGPLPETTAYAVRVLAYTGAPPTSPGTTTEGYSTSLALGGTASRTFIAGGSGTVTLTLSAGGSDTQALGLAIGWFDGAVCRITTEVLANPGANPQITANVDASTYCVRLRDPGGFTAPVGFAVTIVHP